MREEILNKDYLSIYDIQKLIPELGYASASKIIHDSIEEMKEKNMYIVRGHKLLAKKEIVCKRLNIKFRAQKKEAN